VRPGSAYPRVHGAGRPVLTASEHFPINEPPGPRKGRLISELLRNRPTDGTGECQVYRGCDRPFVPKRRSYVAAVSQPIPPLWTPGPHKGPRRGEAARPDDMRDGA